MTSSRIQLARATPESRGAARLALQRTDRPKRDCAITLHADFVHAPERWRKCEAAESGADLVVGELARSLGTRSWRALGAPVRPAAVAVAACATACPGFTALRLIVLRQATRGGTAAPLLTTAGWCASAELLARLAPHARRIENGAHVRPLRSAARPSRVRPWHQLLQRGVAGA